MTEKNSRFGHNVRKRRLVTLVNAVTASFNAVTTSFKASFNAVTASFKASFNAVTRQMTEMSQRKRKTA